MRPLAMLLKRWIERRYPASNGEYVSTTREIPVREWVYAPKGYNAK